MNPYKEIARIHLTEEDLEDLIEEKRKCLTPKRMTKEQEFELELERRLQKLI